MIEKKHPKKDYNKKKSIFFMIGLALTLLGVLLVINYKTYEKQNSSLGDLVIEEIDDEEVTQTQNIVKPPPPPPPPPPPVIVVVEDDVEIEEEIVVEDAEIDEDEEIVIIEEEAEEEIDEIINFAIVEDKPIFPGCEKVSKDQRQRCFQENLIKHVQKVFDYPRKARDNNIQEKIYVKFTVDKAGKVIDPTVVRGKDPSLKQEAIRIINSLPKMQPAKQRGKPVKISFTMPINFSLK